jgi:hypothetical protein
MSRSLTVLSPLLIAGLLCLMLSVAGCGSSAGSDTEKVEDAVLGYLTDFADGDGRDACTQLSGHEAILIFEEAVTEFPQLHASSCSDALTKLSGDLGGEEVEALEAAEIDHVDIHGDSASVTLVGGTTTARLTKAGDNWRITEGISLGG